MATIEIAVTKVDPPVQVFLGDGDPPSGFRFVYTQQGPYIATYGIADRLQAGKRYRVEVGKWWTRIPPYDHIKKIVSE